MFETETEKHCNEAICSNCGHPREGEGNCGVVCHEWRDEYDTFKEGAEFGYNKAKEEMQAQEYNMSYENGIFKCKYKSGKRFESVDGKTWKEIVLPTESE